MRDRTKFILLGMGIGTLISGFTAWYNYKQLALYFKPLQIALYSVTATQAVIFAVSAVALFFAVKALRISLQRYQFRRMQVAVPAGGVLTDKQNWPTKITIPGVEPEHVLYVAIEAGNLEGVKNGLALLAAHQLDVNINSNTPNPTRIPPLHYAARLGKLEIVQHLVTDAKANVNAISNYGITALHEAAAAGHTAVVRLLANNGANFDAVATINRITLTAVPTPQIPYFDIKRQNMLTTRHVPDPAKEICPLQWAVCNEHLDTVKCLIDEFGANTKPIAGRYFASSNPNPFFAEYTKYIREATKPAAEKARYKRLIAERTEREATRRFDKNEAVSDGCHFPTVVSEIVRGYADTLEEGLPLDLAMAFLVPKSWGDTLHEKLTDNEFAQAQQAGAQAATEKHKAKFPPTVVPALALSKEAGKQAEQAKIQTQEPQLPKITLSAG